MKRSSRTGFRKSRAGSNNRGGGFDKKRPAAKRRWNGSLAFLKNPRAKTRTIQSLVEPGVQKEEAGNEPFPFWDLNFEAPIRDLPPQAISNEDLGYFDRTMAASASRQDVGEPIFVTIGLDFGTSSTKIIVRFPYEAGSPAIAIPAPPHSRVAGNPYLWRTVLWLDEGGGFKATPIAKGQLLHTLKQGVIVDGEPLATAGRPVPAEAATAFLCFVLRYVRGWLLVNRPALFSGRRSVWFVNIGIPAATLSSERLTSRFRMVAAAAQHLAPRDIPLNVDSIRASFDEEPVVKARNSVDGAAESGVSIFPEAAAAVVAFARSTNSAPGIYLMVDVGAMTLDACVFRLRHSPRDIERYAFYEAEVRPLGVEAYYWFTSRGETREAFVEQVDRSLWGVVWHALRQTTPDRTWKKGNDLPVFLVGGGARNDLHRKRVAALSPWLRKHAGNEGTRAIDLQLPASIDFPEEDVDVGRMVVAWGLSQPATEIGETTLPHEIEDPSPPPVVDPSTGYVSKDMV